MIDRSIERSNDTHKHTHTHRLFCSSPVTAHVCPKLSVCINQSIYIYVSIYIHIYSPLVLLLARHRVHLPKVVRLYQSINLYLCICLYTHFHRLFCSSPVTAYVCPKLSVCINQSIYIYVSIYIHIFTACSAPLLSPRTSAQSCPSASAPGHCPTPCLPYAASSPSCRWRSRLSLWRPTCPVSRRAAHRRRLGAIAPSCVVVVAPPPSYDPTYPRAKRGTKGSL